MVNIPRQFPLRILSSSNHSRQLYRSYPLSRRAMSSAPNPTTSANSQEAAIPNNENSQQEASSQKTPLPLPEPDHTGDATQLPVGGEGVKLDHLGPLVVNEDGTMSRISNWENMADIEKQNTLRILGKRNKARLDALKAKAQASGSQS
ncbi:hypothetical protein GGS26DRAFT_203955 [Hypomontagnella submonticulosa]|nr:hypothetical protein GGS26DRAFT_203955 [Hypomontagnella submonticulosa]